MSPTCSGMTETLVYESEMKQHQQLKRTRICRNVTLVNKNEVHSGGDGVKESLTGRVPCVPSLEDFQVFFITCLFTPPPAPTFKIPRGPCLLVKAYR